MFKMKRKFLTAAVSLLLIVPAFAAAQTKTIDASDSRITYIGRTEVKDGSVSFDWTGVYARIRFHGNSLSLKASDTRKNYYNVWLDATMDKVPDKVISISGDTTLVLFSAAELKARFGKDKNALKSPHQVILQKRTEGEQGTATFMEFTTDGDFLKADAPKERIIEYVGDSYTCGYGTEAPSTARFSPETENQNLTYACEVARYFGADQIVIAHSGMGIARNYNGNLPGYHMPDRYLQTYDMDKDVKWNAEVSPLKPAVTIIYLGTNDFSVSQQPSKRVFVQNYINLLKEIKANYGDDYPVLCIAPKHDFVMAEYLSKAVETCGFENVNLIVLSDKLHDNSGDIGADFHPNYSGHTKLAYNVIPYVSTVTGWEMTGKPVK